jgi:hypothetical protein
MSGNSTKTNNAATATTGPTGPSMWDEFKKKWLGVTTFTVLAAVMYGLSFWSMLDFQGNADRYNQLKPYLTKIGLYTLFATIALSVAALLYFIQDPQKAMYAILVMSCMAVSMSFGAIAVAAISR